MEYEGVIEYPDKCPVIGLKPPVAVIIKRCVHPEDLALIPLFLKAFFIGENGIFCILFCIPGNPDQEWNPAADYCGCLFNKLESLGRAESFSLTGMRACQKYTFNTGGKPAKKSSQPPAINGPVTLERRDKVSDEPAWCYWIRHLA